MNNLAGYVLFVKNFKYCNLNLIFRFKLAKKEPNKLKIT